MYFANFRQFTDDASTLFPIWVTQSGVFKVCPACLCKAGGGSWTKRVSKGEEMIHQLTTGKLDGVGPVDNRPSPD